MNFNVGDRVEFIYRNKKSVGEINGVYPGTQEVSIKQSDSPVDLLFSDKAVVKVEEQERIVVPQCVADWYEKYKCALEYSIWKYIYEWADQDYESDFYSFMNHACNNPIETLIKMKYGYEVEKEPLYYVKLIDQATGYLNVRNDGRRSLSDSVQNNIFKTQFTEAKIKEMDERYWQFAVPVEDLEGEDNE
ncbi:DUF1642 domain-containing protein [Listeria monocytogenes]|nr:DUF1642 domain-containing protein [Listeria monocytogenes]EAD3860262.1 DUF1642 domain-containing protein [Listeria monocytogenes]EAD3866195.1 DUF1642 domain-containing protein [Listeria monocytogenes]EAD3890447.1 DUF1642 domain-containing protein [Listeria monocytogenes]EAE3710064.1 DUF1642 domain-containing protein [Listeria monocytogenes]